MGRDMALASNEYRIRSSSRNDRSWRSLARDGDGRHRVTVAGNRDQATAEQVPNHQLGALAEVEPGARLKPAVKIMVEHVPE